jgi:hypothetical protein
LPHPTPRLSTRCAAWLAPLLLALACLPALAQYKWKDSAGQVHVSDLPPPRDIPEKDVLTRPNPAARAARPVAAASAGASAAASAPGAARAPVDAELEARRSKAEQEAKARAKTDEDRAAAQRAENCQRARQHLATLETGQRLVQTNAKGERVVLDDAARANETAQARQVMASNCR